MSNRIHAGGSRRANHAGGIQIKPMVSGELRYHARLGPRFLGSFETRAMAQRAIDAATLAEVVGELEYLLREIRTNCGHGFGALLPEERTYAEQLAEAYLLNPAALTAPERLTLLSYVARVRKANEVE